MIYLAYIFGVLLWVAIGIVVAGVIIADDLVFCLTVLFWPVVAIGLLLFPIGKALYNLGIALSHKIK